MVHKSRTLNNNAERLSQINLKDFAVNIFSLIGHLLCYVELDNRVIKLQNGVFFLLYPFEIVNSKSLFILEKYQIAFT